jgi:hypothetical protein
MSDALKIMILIRCVDTNLPMRSIDDMEEAALKIEMQVAPVLLEVLAGTIIVDHVIVDHDSSFQEESTSVPQE